MDPNSFEDSAPGGFVETEAGGRTITAFDPHPLPPKDIDWEEVSSPLGDAAYAVGRLEGVTSKMDTPGKFAPLFVGYESVKSSMIERVNTTLSDAFAAHAGRGGVVDGDRRAASKASDYIDAVIDATTRIDADEQITPALIRDIHGRLLRSEPDMNPGEYRNCQNWIGGLSPQGARYVPPPAERIEEHVGKLTEYANEGRHHPLVRAALAHYLFEAVHPFLDGNGRTGRAVFQLQLYRDCALRGPWICVSEEWLRHRRNYMDLLLAVSRTGAWEEWLSFILRSVERQAERTVKRLHRLQDLRNRYRERYHDPRSEGRVELVESLFSRPCLDVKDAAERADTTYNTANRIVDRLEQDGVLVELTGNDRNRVYLASEVVACFENHQSSL